MYTTLFRNILTGYMSLLISLCTYKYISTYQRQQTSSTLVRVVTNPTYILTCLEATKVQVSSVSSCLQIKMAFRHSNKARHKRVTVLKKVRFNLCCRAQGFLLNSLYFTEADHSWCCPYGEV